MATWNFTFNILCIMHGTCLQFKNPKGIMTFARQTQAFIHHSNRFTKKKKKNQSSIWGTKWVTEKWQKYVNNSDISEIQETSYQPQHLPWYSIITIYVIKDDINLMYTHCTLKSSRRNRGLWPESIMQGKFKMHGPVHIGGNWKVYAKKYMYTHRPAI